MSKPIVLITAANKTDGIAFEAALQLGKLHSFELIITSRSLTSGAEAIKKLQDEGITASLIALDVSDIKSIETVAAAITEKWGKLDVLVHNAGLGAPVAKVEELKKKGTVFLSGLQTTGKVCPVFCSNYIQPLTVRSQTGHAGMEGSIGLSSVALTPSVGSVRRQRFRCCRLDE